MKLRIFLSEVQIQKSLDIENIEAFCNLYFAMNYRLQIYIVTSKPKRMSEYSGLVHMINTSLI